MQSGGTYCAPPIFSDLPTALTQGLKRGRQQMRHEKRKSWTSSPSLLQVLDSKKHTNSSNLSKIVLPKFEKGKFFVGIRLNLQMVFCCQICSDLLCKKFVFYINVVCEWLARWSNLVLWNSPRRCFSFDLIRNLLCPYFSLELLIPEASWFFLPFLSTYFDLRHISIQTSSASQLCSPRLICLIL